MFSTGKILLSLDVPIVPTSTSNSTEASPNSSKKRMANQDDNVSTKKTDARTARSEQYDHFVDADDSLLENITQRVKNMTLKGNPTPRLSRAMGSANLCDNLERDQDLAPSICSKS